MPTSAGTWREVCGKNDAPVVEAKADFEGVELFAFSWKMKPGAGPWPIQSAEGRVSYPPDNPMVHFGEDFLSEGTVREIPGGLAIDVQTPDGIETFEIQAGYEPMSEGERCL